MPSASIYADLGNPLKTLFDLGEKQERGHLSKSTQLSSLWTVKAVSHHCQAEIC